MTTQAQEAASLSTLVYFDGPNGAIPAGKLVQGSDGDFYGTTPAGGAVGPGTVFKVTPSGLLTTLHSFSGGSDGYAPYTGLVQGSDGNFYGTTSGFTGIPLGVLDGTIYRITPAGILTTLYTFSGTAANALVQGSDGNFYGTTTSASSGANKYGSIFVTTPAGVLTTLHTFADTNDQRPTGSLVEGSDGNYYGASSGFGDNRGAGSVFKISSTGTFTKLYNFTGDSNGGAPNGSLVLGNDGNFYGTTQTTVFKMTPAGLLTTLHTFTGSDGKAPVGLALGSDGNFYGTTRVGGVTYAPDGYDGSGTEFVITPTGAFTTLYNFSLDAGGNPESVLVQGSDGGFYGTTPVNGPSGGSGSSNGTLFKLTASTQPGFFTGETALTDGVYYLAFPNQHYFGYYTFLTDLHYLYHFDLGYEYVFDAEDGQNGVYLYDFASSGFFYTSPAFPFPYLYDFNLQSVVYYCPSNIAGRYTSNPRVFYDFATGQNISK